MSVVFANPKVNPYQQVYQYSGTQIYESPLLAMTGQPPVLTPKEGVICYQKKKKITRR